MRSKPCLFNLNKSINQCDTTIIIYRPQKPTSICLVISPLFIVIYIYFFLLVLEAPLKFIYTNCYDFLFVCLFENEFVMWPSLRTWVQNMTSYEGGKARLMSVVSLRSGQSWLRNMLRKSELVLAEQTKQEVAFRSAGLTEIRVQGDLRWGYGKKWKHTPSHSRKEEK